MLLYQIVWNAVKKAKFGKKKRLSLERRNAVEKAKLDGPFSCNRSYMLSSSRIPRLFDLKEIVTKER